MSSASAYDTDLTFDAALAIRSHRPADLACCLASHASHAASSLNRRTGSWAGSGLVMVESYRRRAARRADAPAKTTGARAACVRHASFFAATPCHAPTLALHTEPYGSVYDDPT